MAKAFPGRENVQERRGGISVGNFERAKMSNSQHSIESPSSSRKAEAAFSAPMISVHRVDGVLGRLEIVCNSVGFSGSTPEKGCKIPPVPLLDRYIKGKSKS